MKIFLAGGNGKNKIILKYANISSGGGRAVTGCKLH